MTEMAPIIMPAVVVIIVIESAGLFEFHAPLRVRSIIHQAPQTIIASSSTSPSRARIDFFIVSPPFAGEPIRSPGLVHSIIFDHAAFAAHHRIMAQVYTSFADFWPFYLREHSMPRTRALHYIGTSLVVLIAAATLLTGRWWWFAALPVAGYFFAWVAHFGVEKNRPATFTYPLWSLAADFKMWALWLTGRIGAELDRAGVRRSERSGPP